MSRALLVLCRKTNRKVCYYRDAFIDTVFQLLGLLLLHIPVCDLYNKGASRKFIFEEP
jgi:hypothetical protein